jgi:predicted nucleotidyltransferase
MNGRLGRGTPLSQRSLPDRTSEPSGWRRVTTIAVAAPADVLREALVDAGVPEGAFLFGSTVRGDEWPGSDVDVFLIVREEEPSTARRRQLAEVEFLLGKPLDVVEYGAGTVQRRAHSGNPFISRVLGEPKIWVCGGPESLEAGEAA